MTEVGARMMRRLGSDGEAGPQYSSQGETREGGREGGREMFLEDTSHSSSDTDTDPVALPLSLITFT